jgi:hypothetical protein
MKMKRKTITSHYLDSFDIQVQQHLDNGWVPVPGTIAFAGRPEVFFAFIILEKPE